MRWSLLLILALVMTSGVAAAEIRTGLWQITMTVSITGMPTAVPPQTQQECLSAENMVPQTANAQGCKVRSNGARGNRLEWTMTCDTPNGKANGSGHMEFNGDSMQGSMEMVMNGPAGSLTVVTGLSGRRLGDCR